jgi:hypothetical protein
MISVCPRTAVAINDLIAGLNEFMTAVDLSNSYIALTVFDGAYDYVDLLLFTDDAVSSNILKLIAFASF